MNVTTANPVGVILTLKAGEQFALRLLQHLGCRRMLGVQIEADDHHVTLRVTDTHGNGLVRLRTVKAAAELLGTHVRKEWGMRWANGHYADVPVTVLTHLNATEVTT